MEVPGFITLKSLLVQILHLPVLRTEPRAQQLITALEAGRGRAGEQLEPKVNWPNPCGKVFLLE